MSIDYKKYYEQAMKHLQAVTGSRNSFAPEVYEVLFDSEVKRWRTPEVEEMHKNAVEFLKDHNY